MKIQHLWSSIRQNNKTQYQVKLILRHETANLFRLFATSLFVSKHSLRYNGLLRFILFTPQSEHLAYICEEFGFLMSTFQLI
jgi:hypothetical protein